MDSRDCLAHYPFVVVWIACRVCARRGSYRLARLAAKFGPEISLRDLTERFSPRQAPEELEIVEKGGVRGLT
jgi:hypothetical protein